MWRVIYFILLGCRLRGALGDPQMGNPRMAGPVHGPEMGGPPMGGPVYGPEMGGPPMGGPVYGPEMGGPPMGGPVYRPEMGGPPIDGPKYGPNLGSPLGPLRSGPNNPADQINSLEDDLSPGAFFKIKENEEGPVGLGFGVGETPPGTGPAGPLGYEHFDLATLQAMARQQQQMKENYALLTDLPLGDTTPRNEELLIYNLCFSLSYMWRRGRQSIRKYFHLRDIYVNHMSFEVGYLTHAIMIKYQNILELYQYCATLINTSTPKAMKITPTHMTHFYTSVQEDARTIIHLCNMMHELTAKYDSRPYDPRDRFATPPTTTTESASGEKTQPNRLRGHDGTENKEFMKIDKSYLAKRIEQSHKLIDEAIAQRKKKLQEARDYYEKHRYMASSKRTQQTMRLWSPNLDYGLSGDEEDW